MAFSPEFEPPELAKWLLKVYGESYRDDITKIESAKINGELFLEFAEDEELAKELNLSFAFKRLVKKKAKELKQSNGAMGDGRASQRPPSSITTGVIAAGEPKAQAEPTPTFKALGITDKLSPNHLQQVVDLVWDARAEYYSIGLGLNLPSSDIDSIEKSKNDKPDPIIKEMIKKCLRLGLVTQEKLAKAVSSQQVGFAYLSDRILAEKFTGPQTPRSAPPADVAPSDHADFDRFEVKSHFVSRLEWIDSGTGEGKNIRVYKKAASKWRDVADNLGFETGEIDSIGRKHFLDDINCVTDVLGRWLENANNLPNKKIYPKKWSGLIKLLSDSELGQLSAEVKTALLATYSNVRANLPYVQ